MQPHLDALDHRILRPARTRLAAARATTAGMTDPRAAWEALAARGIIPPSWLADPRRGFQGLCGVCHGRLDGDVCLACTGQGDTFEPWPTSVRLAVALAADVPGVSRAEALAATDPRRDRIVWSLADYDQVLRTAAYLRAALPAMAPDGRALLATGYATAPPWDDAVVLLAPDFDDA